jgi:hypothetical protein
VNLDFLDPAETQWQARISQYTHPGTKKRSVSLDSLIRQASPEESDITGEKTVNDDDVSSFPVSSLLMLWTMSYAAGLGSSPAELKYSQFGRIELIL